MTGALLTACPLVAFSSDTQAPCDQINQGNTTSWTTQRSPVLTANQIANIPHGQALSFTPRGWQLTQLTPFYLSKRWARFFDLKEQGFPSYDLQPEHKPQASGQWELYIRFGDAQKTMRGLEQPATASSAVTNGPAAI